MGDRCSDLVIESRMIPIRLDILLNLALLSRGERMRAVLTLY